MTYADYLIKVTNTMKIRSTNYRLSQNDITLLLNNVYQEVATECMIDFTRQEVTIDATVDTYDLDTLYTQVGNEINLAVISIKDATGADVTKYWEHTGSNVFRCSTMILDASNQSFLDKYDGEVITFNRQVIPDIETLSTKQQVLLFNAILAGMMWYTHDAIPNPTSSNSPLQETDAELNRYMLAKSTLRNQLPQRI